MYGVVEDTAAMFGAVELAPYGTGAIRMWMVSEGWWVCISLPSSTMGIRWPAAGVVYRTMASIAAEKLVREYRYRIQWRR